jgi:4-oxalocrotonate tautomerase family enzyme
MPTITVECFAGRSHEQKALLATRVTDAVVEAFEVEPAVVRVKFQEVERHNSAQGGQLPPPIDG